MPCIWATESSARPGRAQALALKVRARGQEYNRFKARRALESSAARPDAARKRSKGAKQGASEPSADVQARRGAGSPLSVLLRPALRLTMLA